jgi:hypothetical protein
VLVGLVCWSCVCFVSFFVPKNGGLILAQYWPLAHYCPSVGISGGARDDVYHGSY